MVHQRRWMNAVMLDVVRITERYSYYRELIPRLAGWGVNTLFWHFTDDQGCALQLKSHPELASRYAFTRSETERLITLCRRHDIEVIPEVESLGHTLYITHLDQYKHLFRGSRHFNAIKPSDPESLAIIGDILSEVAEIFPSRYLHVGLDEVQFNETAPASAGGGAEAGSDRQLFIGHMLAVHRIVTGLDKTMILWGDHLVRDKAIADAVPHDCIVAHWDYYTPESPIAEHHEQLSAMGFKLISCPSAARYFNTVMPDGSNLRNLREFAQISHQNRDRGEIGLMNTIWCPERQLGGSTHYGIALGAALAEHPVVDEQRVAEQFLSDSYGLKRCVVAARALRELHEASPGMRMYRKVLVEDAATHKFAVTAADVEEAGRLREQLATARKALEDARERVTLRKREYQVWIIAAQLQEELLGRFQMWHDARALDDLRTDAATRGDSALARHFAEELAGLLKDAARDARRSARRAESDWGRVRHKDDPRRSGQDGYISRTTALPGMLDRTARFIETVAASAAKAAEGDGRGEILLPRGSETEQ